MVLPGINGMYAYVLTSMAPSEEAAAGGQTMEVCSYRGMFSLPRKGTPIIFRPMPPACALSDNVIMIL